jgi:3-isopropylmalate/(R)-2-methylmalate dehydratase small subunit
MRERSSLPLFRRGTCHVFGNDLPIDDGIMPYRLAVERVTDAQRLVPHLFETVDPGFAGRARAGDIILAGSNFACGKPRAQAFIALAALGVGIVCESMPYKMLRRAVARGLPVITGFAQSDVFAASGDELEIDFASGAAWNSTRDTRVVMPAMPQILQEIVSSGGTHGSLTAWLVAHPEQAASAQAR